jgi:cobalt/nickel transport system permease protein
VKGELAICPCGCIGKRRKGGFVQKTIEGGAGIMREAIFSDDVSRQDGFLQRLDPRVKLLSLLGLLIVAAFVRNVQVLVAMYAATLALAVVSALPLGFFVKRVWLFVPIFTGIVVLPAMFSFITPGHIVVTTWYWHGEPVGLTQQGITSAAMIVTRVATSISLVVLLTLTTPWSKLLAALRALGVPKIFILIIGMAYRYIFLLLGSVTDMYTARKARTIGNDQGEVKEGQRFVAATAGALFGKAQTLSEEVHQAMVARGYSGDAKSITEFHATAVDWVFLAGCAIASVLVLGGDHLLGV